MLVLATSPAVTLSMSFLGPGLPWTIATLYHSAQGQRYIIVPVDSLGFSVGVFCALSTSSVLVLHWSFTPTSFLVRGWWRIRWTVEDSIHFSSCVDYHVDTLRLLSLFV